MNSHPPSTPRRRARVATRRVTRRTKYSSRHERARARITDRIAPYLDRWPRTTDNLRDRGSARPRARSPTNDRARRFPSDRRPNGERAKKKPARSPRLARARLAPGTLARASSRTVEPSIRARAMDAPPSGLDGESRPVVCLVRRARARGKRGDDSVYSVVSKTMKRRAGDGRGRDDVARAGVNRRVMNRRVSDSTTGPPRVLDTHRAVGRSFLRHPSGIAVLHIYTGSK